MNISPNIRTAVALSALAALAVLGYLTQSYHSHTADNDAAILNLAGRQRMLATRVAYFSGQLAIYRGQAAKQEEIRRNLLRAVEEMDAEHQVLAHGNPEFTADPAVRHIYFDAPAELDRLTGEYIAAARAMAQGQANSAGPGDPNFDRVAQMVIPMVDLTNEAVKRYEVSAGQRIGRLRMMEIGGLLAMLAGLVMTWLAIFRPMARRIAQDMREQEAANAELAQGNATLARQKAELEQEKQLTEDLRQRLQAILDAAGEGITGLDLEGKIIFANAASEHLLGYPPDSLLGAGHHELFHHSHGDGSPYPAEQCPIHEALVKGQPYRSDHEIFWRADGHAMPVDVVSMPLHEHGVLVGAVLVFGDITERRTAEEAVRRTLCELERSNRELDDFAYIASHDLKEPLRGIYNYSTFLLEDYGSRLDEEGKRYLDTLLRLTQRLESLVDTLLHYSRLGRTRLDREDCDLAEVLAEVLDSLAPMIQETHAAVHVEGPLPRVACNRVMVGELLHNLIVNGLKYNDSAEKKIGIGCVPGAVETVYYVRDNGIGIPEKHQESIFRIFKRLHGRDKYGGGTGAGLTIVKKIVERHGGKIWVESQPGAGSTFYFTLEGAGSDE